MTERSRCPKGKSETVFVGVVSTAEQSDASPGLETRRAEAFLLVIAGPRKGAEYALGGDLAQIGRDPQNDVPLDDPAASRIHATVLRRGGRFYLRDCGSTNGTYFDGEVLHASEAELSEGARFCIGETEFLFRHGAGPTG